MILFRHRCCQIAVLTMMFLPFLSYQPGKCGQITENEASELSKESIRKSLGPVFIASYRDVDLEKSISSLFDKSTVQAPFIFHNSTDGKEVKENKIIEHASNPKSPDFIVAVSDSGAVFRISPFTDSKMEIERLCLYYGISLKNIDAVRTFMHFYIAITPESRMGKIIESVEAARARAKEKIVAWFGDKEGEALFGKWWQNHCNDINILDFKIHIAEPKKKKYLVTFYCLSDLSNNYKDIAVLKVSLKLSSTGNVGDPKYHSVWR
jgi:hypothetical protein